MGAKYWGPRCCRDKATGPRRATLNGKGIVYIHTSRKAARHIAPDERKRTKPPVCVGNNPFAVCYLHVQPTQRSALQNVPCKQAKPPPAREKPVKSSE